MPLTSHTQEADENQKTIIALREQVRQQEIEILHLSSAASAPLTPTQATALSSARQTMATGGGADMRFGASARSAGSSVFARGPALSQSTLQPQVSASPAPRQHGENWLFLFRADLQRAMDMPNKCRSMTINETRDLVDQMFESKALSNSKSAKTGSAGLLVETMEMHVYKTMEKKYGLRSLAAEHTGALLTSVQRFARQDNAITVFMKVFSNEVEEEFRAVQTELSRSITDLLRVQLMSK